jgi:hypothetical protein
MRCVNEVRERAVFEMPKKASLKKNPENIISEMPRNVSYFELPATFAAALADALQLQALLVFAQEELVTLMEKMKKI